MTFTGHALIVTADKNLDAKLPDLGANVRADGDVVEQVLVNREVCGYGQDRVTRLSGTNANINSILDTMEVIGKLVAPEDPVFFYFSGHGDTCSCDGSPGASLFPYDANVDECKSVLTSKVLGHAWSQIPSRRKLAVVDACYSGGLRLTKATAGSEKGLTKPQLVALSEGEGSVLISSSRLSEPSLILGKYATSLFTKHFADGLLGKGGHDVDGFVRVFDLFNYVAINVRQDAPSQSPVYAAYHQDLNFAVAYCADQRGRKSIPRSIICSDKEGIRSVAQVFCALYPLGPTDQAIWERAGGDLSRLNLSGQGRTDWFRALQLIDRGGTDVTIDALSREATTDYPRNRDLEALGG